MSKKSIIIKKEGTEKFPLFVLQNIHGDIFELNITESKNTESKHVLVSIDLYPVKKELTPKIDPSLVRLVIQLLSKYIQQFPKTILYFTPDNTDDRKEGRLRKFSSWYDQLSNRYAMYHRLIKFKSEEENSEDEGYEFDIICFHPLEISENEIKHYIDAVV